MCMCVFEDRSDGKVQSKPATPRHVDIQTGEHNFHADKLSTHTHTLTHTMKNLSIFYSKRIIGTLLSLASARAGALYFFGANSNRANRRQQAKQ